MGKFFLSCLFFVPEGRPELTRVFSRPFGTRSACQSDPGVETPGYFQAVPAGQSCLRQFHFVFSSDSNRANLKRFLKLARWESNPYLTLRKRAALSN
jgi:hypothetical protein